MALITAQQKGFSTILEGHLAALAAPEALPVIICGMAGSRQGWLEAPYVTVPAPLGAILAGAARVPGQSRDIRIVPGLAQRQADAPDVMRGEETQLAGAGLPAKGRQLVCMPGTHSKWVQVEDGAVAGFRHLADRRAVLGACRALDPAPFARRSIPRRSPRTTRSSATACRKARREGGDSPEAVLHPRRRAAAGPQVADGCGGNACPGLLIGGEIASAQRRYGAGGDTGHAGRFRRAWLALRGGISALRAWQSADRRRRRGGALPASSEAARENGMSAGPELPDEPDRTPFPSSSAAWSPSCAASSPTEAVAIGQALFDAGIEAIEVPLNSPEPFVSIASIVEALPGTALVGAGTVLTPADVDGLHKAGGRLLVSPNIDAEVMARAMHHGMVTMPGVFTPTEAFQAIRLGASALKFFPASVLGAEGISAIRAVLPGQTLVGAVGGVSEKDFAGYKAVGVTVFGLGSSLFKPGMSVDEVAGARARRRRGLGRGVRRSMMSEASFRFFPIIVCQLGEGPSYDPPADTLFWFDIVNGKLLEKAGRAVR